MSLEELFVKEYEKSVRNGEELEKAVALLTFENEDYRKIVEECKWLIKTIKPYKSKSDHLFVNTHCFFEGDQERLLKLMNKLKIPVEKQTEEIEKR